MKLKIKFSDNIEKGVLEYVLEDFSFLTVPVVYGVNFELYINKIVLTVGGDDDKIVQIWGFSGFKEWGTTKCSPPNSSRGIVCVSDTMNIGSGAHPLIDYDVKVSLNGETGWVCFGDPARSGIGVEFLERCIMVLNDENEFISLWLKPIIVPSELDWQSIVKM